VLGLKFVLRVNLPCVQVAGQQGAYVARMINRGYSMGVGGMDVAPPVKVDPALGEVRELAQVASSICEARLPLRHGHCCTSVRILAVPPPLPQVGSSIVGHACFCSIVPWVQKLSRPCSTAVVTVHVPDGAVLCVCLAQHCT
jgi:hypothetical protein